MSLELYGHRFSSYTQKVLVALYENATPFEFRCIAPDEPQHVAEWLRRWPLRKFPLLVDGERSIVETSIIIEYLQLVHPGPLQLLPSDPMAALQVRFFDRYFDLHIMDAAQHAVDGALTGDPVKRREGQALAQAKLERAYAWLVWGSRSKLNHFRAFRPECGVARRRHSAAMTSPRALPRAEIHRKFLQVTSGAPH